MRALFSGLARFIIWLLLVAAAATFIGAFLVGVLIFLSIWTLRASWARLTGRPVTPFVMRMNPRSGFEQMFRSRNPMQAEGTPLRPEHREIADITDVEPKEPR